MAIRSFLAFELSPEIRWLLRDLREELMSRLEGIRWVPLENIHLTVLFLGNIEERDLSPLGEKVGEVAQKYKGFWMKITGMGIFGGIKNPRVLWVGMDGEKERMGYFKASLEKALEGFGIKREERTFKPHLTLGRFQERFKQFDRLQELLDSHRSLKETPQFFEELSLFKSQLTSSGSIYTKLSSWKLEGSK